jgi:hypothetical protein
MTAQSQLPIGRQPTHRLYTVRGNGQSARWTPIGAAWPNKDGKGFTVACDMVPLQGRMVLRLIEPKAANDAEGGQQ